MFVFGGFDGTTFMGDMHCGVLEARTAEESTS